MKAIHAKRLFTTPKQLLALYGLCAAAAWAQSLDGAVDIHVHSDPDSLPRALDGLDAAKLAHARHMRAVVLKNHYEPTASLAFLARKEVPGIEVFGGIALNLPVGGVNPSAVDNMARVKGHWGRMVWMPTFDAENQVRDLKSDRPFVSVSKDGQLLPKVLEVLALIAKYNLTLATGHSTAEEDLMLIRAAKEAGVTRMVLTHPIIPPTRMTVEQMKQAAALGAYVEFTYGAVIGSKKYFELTDYAAAIRAIGPEHCILSSDLGGPNRPMPPASFEEYLRGLHALGFTAAELDQMSKTNPARLLGLE